MGAEFFSHISLFAGAYAWLSCRLIWGTFVTCLCSCLRAEFQGCFGADLQPYFAAIQELGLLYRSLVHFAFGICIIANCRAQCGHTTARDFMRGFA